MERKFRIYFLILFAVFVTSCEKDNVIESMNLDIAQIQNKSLKANGSGSDFFSVANKIRRYISEQFGINHEEVLLESKFNDDLGLIDLDLQDVFIFCENEFSIVFEDSDIDKIVTVNDLVNFCFQNMLDVVEIYPPGTNPSYPGLPGNPGFPGSPGFPGEVGGGTDTRIKLQLLNRPFGLLPDVPCEIIEKWLATARHQVKQAQIDKLNQVRTNPHIVPNLNYDIVARVQKIDDASSSVVNMDYFPINIKVLPIVNGARQTPEQFLSIIRKDINNFVNDKYAVFEPYKWYGIDDKNLWQSNNPLNSVIGIDIYGPYNASVIVSDFSNNKWTFTTIYDPKYGQHPVSGNRDFGFVKESNGSYTFYTRGVDRLTTGFDALVKDVAFSAADNLWKSFQDKVSTYVNQHGGVANIVSPKIERPDWVDIEKVVKGIKPISTLRSDC